MLFDANLFAECVKAFDEPFYVYQWKEEVSVANEWTGVWDRDGGVDVLSRDELSVYPFQE